MISQPLQSTCFQVVVSITDVACSVQDVRRKLHLHLVATGVAPAPSNGIVRSAAPGVVVDVVLQAVVTVFDLSVLPDVVFVM